LATGAFEIYIDDTLVFSKLKSGHLPSAEDVHSFMQGFGLE
jgi:selT/selW/selH-like putative selenoprotein